MPKYFSLSKSLFMDGMRCPKLLWLKFHRPELAEPFDAPTLHLFDIGHQVEELARTPFPGVLIDRTGNNFSELVQQTTTLMSDSCFSIFEGTFKTKNTYCRADILQPSPRKNRNSWILNEIKMSTKVKDDHYLDCGFQLHCIEKSGYDIDQVNLIHINSDYNRQERINPLDLFTIEDITDTARKEAEIVSKSFFDFKEVCSSSEPPEVILGSRCKNPGRCQFYNVCHNALPPGSVYEIPYGHTIIPVLLKKGIQKIVDIPSSLISTKRRMALVQSAKTGKPVINIPDIKSLLEKIVFPVYFLDFETIAPCIPQFDNTKPYEKLPFQYSLHILRKPGGKTVHFEYLHNSVSDPCIPLAKDLLCHIGKKGSVIAWNKSFEESVLKLIANRYPQFSSQVSGMLTRFVDLITPFRNGAYTDHRFRGSASIKRVLPVLVPDLSYKGMSIKRGDEASLLFEKYVEGSLLKEEWVSFRKDLLNYCSLDTIAMVRIYEELCRLTIDKSSRVISPGKKLSTSKKQQGRNIPNIFNRKQRGLVAKRKVDKILTDQTHRLYTASDNKIAETLHVSRLTIFNIRKQLSIKPRKERIIDLLNNIDTSLLTLKELSARTGVKYPNLYKIVRSLNIKTKADIRPIEKMVQYQQQKKHIRLSVDC